MGSEPSSVKLSAPEKSLVHQIYYVIVMNAVGRDYNSYLDSTGVHVAPLHAF